MLPVIYSMSVTLDGYIAGPDDDIGWSAPSTERLAFHNEQTRHIAAYVCGRRLYQDMLVWETAEQIFTDPVALEFARIWRPIPKVVFSRTLETVEGNARLARDDITTELNRRSHPRRDTEPRLRHHLPPLRTPPRLTYPSAASLALTSSAIGWARRSRIASAACQARIAAASSLAARKVSPSPLMARASSKVAPISRYTSMACL